jgi:membrane protease YdiL (CAAX protease family)
MTTHMSRGQSPWHFVLLIFILSIPFWLMGAVTGRLLPEEVPMNLPASALMFVCPLLAAVILVYKEDRVTGVKRLLKRAFDFGRIKGRIWYIPMLGLMPGVMFLEYGWLKLTRVSIPDFQLPAETALVLFAAFFISALGEELGWSGYVIDPLQARWGALKASLIVGTVWGVWHIVPFFQSHHTLCWVAGQFGKTVVERVLIVWLYNNTGKSVFAAVTFHAIDNFCLMAWLPVYGSFYDPSVAFVIMAVIATIVSCWWGPQTLARYRAATPAKTAH